MEPNTRLRVIKRLKAMFKRKKLRYATDVSGLNGTPMDTTVPVKSYKGRYYPKRGTPKGGFKLYAHCSVCGKKRPQVTIDFKLYECVVCNTMEEKL